MDLEDACAGRFVGEREFDLSVESAGSEEGGIEDVYTVGSGDDL